MYVGGLVNMYICIESACIHVLKDVYRNETPHWHVDYSGCTARGGSTALSGTGTSGQRGLGEGVVAHGRV